jgi:hypothetical protein
MPVVFPRIKSASLLHINLGFQTVQVSVSPISFLLFFLLPYEVTFITSQQILLQRT